VTRTGRQLIRSSVRAHSARPVRGRSASCRWACPVRERGIAEITNIFASLDRSVVRSSVIPSARYCCSRSSLRLAKGSTTIDGRGAATGGSRASRAAKDRRWSCKESPLLGTASPHIHRLAGWCDPLGARRRGDPQLLACVRPRRRRHRGELSFSRHFSDRSWFNRTASATPSTRTPHHGRCRTSPCAAEVRGDPRPIARTVFEDPAPAREVAERGTVIAGWIAGPEIHM
jgi:hypothetical protein